MWLPTWRRLAALRGTLAEPYYSFLRLETIGQIYAFRAAYYPFARHDPGLRTWTWPAPADLPDIEARWYDRVDAICRAADTCSDCLPDRVIRMRTCPSPYKLRSPGGQPTRPIRCNHRLCPHCRMRRFLAGWRPLALAAATAGPGLRVLHADRYHDPDGPAALRRLGLSDPATGEPFFRLESLLDPRQLPGRLVGGLSLRSVRPMPLRERVTGRARDPDAPWRQGLLTKFRAQDWTWPVREQGVALLVPMKPTRRGRPRASMPRGRTADGWAYPDTRPYRLRTLGQSLLYVEALPKWLLTAPLDRAGPVLSTLNGYPRLFGRTSLGVCRPRDATKQLQAHASTWPDCTTVDPSDRLGLTRALLTVTIRHAYWLPAGAHRSEAAFARRLLSKLGRTGRATPAALQTALTLRARVAYHLAALESGVPV